MSDAATQILEQILCLSQEERAAVAHAVLLSLDPEDPDAEEAWNEELIRRVARIESGETVGIPEDQVFEEWRRNLP
jgi:putative addiction module component (TIGR02574 family)